MAIENIPLPQIIPGGSAVAAMRNINSLSDEQLKTKEQELENKYYAPKSEADIARMNALADLTQQQAKYYGPNTESTIGYRNALIQMLNQQIPFAAPKEQADIDLLKAQAFNQQQAGYYTPLKEAIAAQTSSRAQSRFMSPAYQMKNMLIAMPQAARQAWIAAHSAAYSKMIEDLATPPEQQNAPSVSPMMDYYFGNQGKNIFSPMTDATIKKQLQSQGVANLPASGAPPQQPQRDDLSSLLKNKLTSTAQGAPQPQQPQRDNLSSLLKNKLLSALAGALQPQQAPATSPVTSNDVAAAYKNKLNDYILNAPAGDQGGSDPNSFAGTPQSYAKQMLSNQMSANSLNVDKPIRDRAQAAISMERWLKENQPAFTSAMNTISKFSGYPGKIREQISKWESTNSPEYQDLMFTRNVMVPFLISQEKKILGLNSTDKQREELEKTLQGIADMHVRPEAAKNLIHRSLNAIRSISKADLEAAQPVYPGVYQKIYGLDLDKDYFSANNGKNASDEDLAFTAKKHGITVEKLKTVLRTKGWNI